MLRFLIWYSVITYVIELILGSSNSLEGNQFFLWSERIVASIFTGEFAYRLYRDKLKYGKSFLGFADLISIVPFWLGFFVPVEYLGQIRALRILRLLKCFRYNESLQFVQRSFERAMPSLRSLFFAIGIFGSFASIAIYEVEKTVQPDTFTLANSFWFTAVTMTTVGYGDMSPVTGLGKILTCCTFLVALALYSGIIGVITDSFMQELRKYAH